MIKLLTAIVCLMLIAGMALTQPGSIGVFADPSATNVNLDNTVGFMHVYCVHVLTYGATGCQFMIQVVGTPLMYVGDTSPFPTVIGNSQSGVAIAYGACYSSPIHVLTVTYMGVSPACDMVKVVDDPTASPPGIYMTDCEIPVPNLLVAGGWFSFINNDGTCRVLSEETTWGQVKALYQ